MLYSAAWGIPFAFPETPRCHNLALGATSWKTPATDFSFSPPFHCSTESRVFLSISWGGNIHKHIPGPGRDSVFSFTDTKTGIRSQSEVKSFDKFCHVRHMLEFSLGSPEASYFPHTPLFHHSERLFPRTVAFLASEHFEQFSRHALSLLPLSSFHCFKIVAHAARAAPVVVDPVLHFFQLTQQRFLVGEQASTGGALVCANVFVII